MNVPVCAVDLEMLQAALSARRGRQLLDLLEGPQGPAAIHAAVLWDEAPGRISRRWWRVLATHPNLDSGDIVPLLSCVDQAIQCHGKANLDELYRAREDLLRDPRFPPDELEGYVTATRSGRCLAAVLDNPACSPSFHAAVLSRLSSARESGLAKLAQQQHQHGETSQQLAVSGSVGVCGELLRKTPEDRGLMRLMAGHPDRAVRCMLASRCADVEVLGLLSRDKDTWVRNAAAGNPALAATDRQKLAGDPDQQVRLQVAATARDPELLIRMADDSRMRFPVARNPACPPGLLGTLAQDQDETVRQAVGGHRRAATEMLVRLAGDPVGAVRAAAAGHRRVPPTVLVSLSADGDQQVRRGVAGNPACPTVLLGKLLCDPVEGVRWAAAANPNLSPAARAMWQLARGTT
jgi:hypothetical protein